MSFAQVAERYGRAIFELGLESGQLPQLTEQLRSLATLYRENKELRSTLEDPVRSEVSQKALVDELSVKLALSPHAKNTLLMLAQRRRLGALPEIAARLATLADEKSGILRVTLTSAEPLAQDYASQLISQLEQSTGRRVVVEKKVDPTLIAGVIASIGDNTIDGSLSGRLREMEHQLLAVG